MRLDYMFVEAVEDIFACSVFSKMSIHYSHYNAEINANLKIFIYFSICFLFICSDKIL